MTQAQVQFSADKIIELLSLWGIRTAKEEWMQSDIAFALTTEEVPFEREVAFGPRDRIDFLVGTVGVECKVAGSANQVMRQLSRYAESDRITELVLVTSKASHRQLNNSEMMGKIIRVRYIWGIG